MSLKKHSIGTLAVLLLTCVFAACLLLTLAYGVQAYRTVAGDTESAYTRRIGLSYVTQKIHSFDRQGAITTGNFGGQDALILREESDGLIFETMLYVYDGWLRELYFAQGLELHPEDGDKLLEAQAFTVSAQGQTLHLSFTGADGQTAACTLTLRSSGGAA